MPPIAFLKILYCYREYWFCFYSAKNRWADYSDIALELQDKNQTTALMSSFKGQML